MSIADEQWMARVAQGDARAFEQLVRAHLPRAYAIARRILLTPQDAEDAAQEAFTKIWVKASEWQPGRAAFTTWMHRIVVNSALDMVRKRQPRVTSDPMVLEHIADESPGADETLSVAQERAVVMKAVEQLTAQQRAAVTLCYFEEMSNEEAARAMGIHLKALEGLLVRARKALRETLPTRKGNKNAA